MQIPLTVQIVGLPFLKEAITRFLCEASFSDDVSSDYLGGFYDCGNGIVSVLESIENGQKYE